MHVDAGDLDAARALAGPAGAVPDLPQDWLWIEATTAAAHVRAALGDTAAAAALYRTLASEAGRMDVTAGVFLGGVDLALAVLAEVLEDVGAARRHADDAVARLEALGTRPALARALVVRARLLAAVGVVPVLRAVDRLQVPSKVASV